MKTPSFFPILLSATLAVAFFPSTVRGQRPTCILPPDLPGGGGPGGLPAAQFPPPTSAPSPLSAEGYALGTGVVFAPATTTGGPDLRLVAHEAAHVVQQRSAGGNLGGEIVVMNGTVTLQVLRSGKRSEAEMNLDCVIHLAPRPNAGADVETFDMELVSYHAEATSLPDFSLLRLTGGTAEGFEGMGKTTLTRLPDGTFACDSFFDITYRLDITGDGPDWSGVTGAPTLSARLGFTDRAFGGQLYEPRGGAVLGQTADGLLVHNFGSTGQDGVELRLALSRKGYEYYRSLADRPSGFSGAPPEGDGTGIEIDGLSLSNLGSSLAVGWGGPWPCAGLPENCNGVEMTLTGGGSVAGAVHWGRLDAVQTLVEVWNEGHLVRSAVVESSTPVFTSPDGSFVPDEVRARKRPGRVKYANVTLKRGAGPGQIVVGGVAVSGDEVRLSPYDPRGASVNLGGLTLLGTNLPTLTLRAPKTVVIPHVLDARGGAVLGAGPGPRLRVENLGSSGQDGVAIASDCCLDHDDDGDGFLPLVTEMLPLDLRGEGGAGGTTGGSLFLRAFDGAGGELAVAECRDNGSGGGGSGGSVWVDFTGNGATACIVAVMNGNTLIGQVSVPIAGLTQVCAFGEGADGYPLVTGCGKRRGIRPWENSCLVEEFDRVVPISPTSGGAPPMLGDTLLLLAADPTPGVLDTTASFGVAVANLDGFDVCAITSGAGLPDGPVMASPGDYPGGNPTFQMAGPVFLLDPPSPVSNAGLKVESGWKVEEGEKLTDDGTQATFTGKLTMRLTGVGDHAGFSRTLELPGTFAVSRSPSAFAGEPVQEFGVSIDSFSFELPPGDPDFDLLRVASSVPSVGSATARELTGGGFQIDSFFDVFTVVTLTGAPGSQFAGTAWTGNFTEPWKLVSQGMFHSGFAHATLGGVALEPDPAKNLIVSNIGSSGQDGVSIDLPKSESFTLLSQDFCPPAPGAVESSLRFEEFGNAEGLLLGGSLGTCRVRFRPAFFDVFCDFSPVEPSSTAVRVYSAGVLVAEFPSPTSALALQAFPVGGGSLPPVVEIGKLSARSAIPCKRIRWGGACQFRVGAAAPVVGDEVRLLAHGVAFEAVSRFDIHWTDCAPCVIGTEWAGLAGREITSSAMIRSQDHNSSRSNKTNTIIVDLGGGFGNNPNDLCSISVIPPSESGPVPPTGKRQHKPMRIRTEGITHEAVGSVLRVEGFGGIGGDPNASLGSVSVVRSAAGLDLSGDFSSRGLTSVRVLVFDDRVDRLQPVTAVDKATPLLCRLVCDGAGGVPPGISGFEVGHVSDKFANEGFFDISVGFEDQVLPARVDFLDGTSVLGTRIRVCVMDPAVEAEDISRLVLSGAGLKPFIVDEIGTGTFSGQGVRQWTVGGAQLEDNPSGRLVVTNIGSSGQDGVSIDLAESAGVWQTCAPLPVVGTGGRFALFGEIRDDDCDGDTFLGIEPNGDLIASTPDFATPVAAKFVLLDANGAVSGTFSVADIRVKKRPGRESPTLASLGGTARVVGYGFVPETVIEGYGHLGACYRIAFDAPVTFFGPGSQPFEGRVLCLTLQDVDDACYTLSVPNGPGPQRLSARSLTAFFGGNGPVTVTETELRHFGDAPITALEGSHFQVSNGQLLVSNIGSSGNDGVSVDLGRADHADFSFNPVEIKPTGIRGWGLHATHSSGEAGTAVLGPLSGNDLPLSADFTALGTASARVVVLSGGVVVGQYVAGSSALGVIDASAPKLITGCGKLRSFTIPGGIRPPCYYWKFGNVLRITPPGGGVGSSLLGDELRVLAEGATVPIVELRTFDIRAASAPSAAESFTMISHPRPDFHEWLLSHFTAAEIDLIVQGGDCNGDGVPDPAYQCDHDGDELTVIEEYAGGRDPNRPDGGGDALPDLVRTTMPGGTHIIDYSYEVDPNAAVEIQLRDSTDLVAWDSDPADYTLIDFQEMPDGHVRYTYRSTSTRIREYRGHVTILK